jgi:hypothetical protein
MDRMTFNKPTEWGKRFSFPENVDTSLEDLQMRVTEKIFVQMVDNYETAVVAEIASAARAAGVTDCTVLNKKAILDALNKQIPQKPIRDSLADRACPACDAYIPFDALNDRLSDAPNFCKHCGQALDWEDA